MNQKLKEKTLESLSAVLPITAIVLILSIFLVPIDIGTIAMFFVGAFMLIIGMGMFQLGSEMAMCPIGEGIGVQASRSRHIVITLILSFIMGMIITVAEPDLQILSEQVPAIPNMVLIMTVAVGVGIFMALAVLRILKKINLSNLLIGLYAVLLILSFFIPKDLSLIHI